MEMNDFSQNLDLINDRHDQTQAVHGWSLDGGQMQRWRSKNLILIMCPNGATCQPADCCFKCCRSWVWLLGGSNQRL
jgi:hypothetical protein